MLTGVWIWFLSLSGVISIEARDDFLCKMFVGIQAFICPCNRGSLAADYWCWFRPACIYSYRNHSKRDRTLFRNKILWGYPMHSTRACYCKTSSTPCPHFPWHYIEYRKKKIQNFSWFLHLKKCICFLQLKRICVCGPRYWPQQVELVPEGIWFICIYIPFFFSLVI